MMLDAADRWFAAQSAGLPVQSLSACCEIGSGIVRLSPKGAHLRRALLARGVQVINFDYKTAPEIDISGDIFDPAVNRKLQELRPRLLICTNMVEHVPAARLGEFTQILYEILDDQGHLFISGPRSHPYHLDPIDNLYRPAPDELAKLFPKMSRVAETIVAGPTYWDELKDSDGAYRWRVLRRLLKPLPKFERWKATAHRFFWLWRPYRETCVVLRKPAGGGSSRS